MKQTVQGPLTLLTLSTRLYRIRSLVKANIRWRDLQEAGPFAPTPSPDSARFLKTDWPRILMPTALRANYVPLVDF